MERGKTIIPIAGGKGGVGKTFLTANLAVALARRGHSTIAVDLDLGNSNLHSFLGLENRYEGVGAFLRGTAKGGLPDLIVETRVPGLGFIAGDGRMPFMANITYNQKRTLLRVLRLLPARYILLDLSAGTGFNTLDLFLSGDSGILVTTPEYPAIMNMLVFVKNLVLRAIDQSLRGDTSVTEKLNELYKQSMKSRGFTVDAFRRDLSESHPKAAAKIDDICKQIRPRLVYNMIESPEDTEIFARIDRTLADTLSVECDHFGLIPYDASVRQSMKRPEIFFLQAPSSLTAETIDRIARRVIRFWDSPVEGSAGLLAEYARAVLAGARSQGEASPER
ncbi:MAG TPA: P-loop NTPase [Blastocatellia bacterium]|nr:P-loop NTPase [Blastocatellia bacterium]